MSNKNAKFYVCKHCGNFVGMIFNSGASMRKNKNCNRTGNTTQ